MMRMVVRKKKGILAFYMFSLAIICSWILSLAFFIVYFPILASYCALIICTSISETFFLFVGSTLILYRKSCDRSSPSTIIKRGYSTQNSALDPWFITGFTDAEGCFRVSVILDKSSRIGFSVKICYNITLHSRDTFVLEQIKAYFVGIGNISVQQASNRCVIMKLKI